MWDVLGVVRRIWKWELLPTLVKVEIVVVRKRWEHPHLMERKGPACLLWVL